LNISELFEVLDLVQVRKRSKFSFTTARSSWRRCFRGCHQLSLSAPPDLETQAQPNLMAHDLEENYSHFFDHCYNQKGKANPVTGRGGP
jgi:hypothetical protein